MGIAEKLEAVAPIVRNGSVFTEMRGSLFVERAPATSVIILERGCVALERITQDGTLSFAGLLMPGDIHFERNDAHQWHGRALDGAIYASEWKVSFQQRLSRDPAAMMAYVASVERQLQRQRELTDVRNYLRVISRLAGLILWLAGNMPHRDMRTSKVVGVKFPFRHPDIAMMLNTHREAVTKMLGVLRRRRIIESPERAAVLLIHDEDSLRRLVDGDQRALT